MTNEIKISKLDCYYKIKEITEEPSYVRPKRQKLCSFENITEVLKNCGVLITKIPEEKESRKKWQSEKFKIISAFDRVIEEKKKYEKHPATYKIEGNFFDSNEYDYLTKLIKPTDNDKDYVMEIESVEHDVEMQTELKRKKGPGRPLSEKPLIEFSDPWIKKKLEKTYATLLKEFSDLKVPFDQYLAKFALMFYYTAGENYNHKKGQMFNKVVTLGVFYKLFQFIQNMIKHHIFFNHFFLGHVSMEDHVLKNRKYI